MIASNASKELEALAAHMQDIPDAMQESWHWSALGVSLKDAQTKSERGFLLPQCIAGNHRSAHSAADHWGFFFFISGSHIGGDCFLLRSGSPLVDRSVLFPVHVSEAGVFLAL